MPAPAESAPEILQALADHYGRPSAHPAEAVGSLGAVLSAHLARSLDARKVDAAIDALREANLLTPEALAEADVAEVVGLLGSAGVKVTPKLVAPLPRLARWFVEVHDPLDQVSNGQLRDGLLGLNGIGQASADEILLRGLGRASYPVDRASYRVVVRHGWIDPTAEYDEARAVLERLAPDDPAGLATLADGMDRLGRDFCKAGAPRCEHCPLRPFLPEGGALDPEG